MLIVTDTKENETRKKNKYYLSFYRPPTATTENLVCLTFSMKVFL